jgi:PAS domain S-box-containing protein
MPTISGIKTTIELIWDASKTILEIITIAIIPAFLFFRKKLKQGIRFLYVRLPPGKQIESLKMEVAELKRSNASFLDVLKEVRDMVGGISREVHTNGGLSLKDLVIKQDRKISLMQNQFKVMQANLNYGLLQTDEHGKIISANAVFCEITGREQAEVLGNGIVNCFIREDQDNYKKMILSGMMDLRAIEGIFKLQHAEQGNPFSIKLVGEPVIENNAFIGYNISIKKI